MDGIFGFIVVISIIVSIISKAQKNKPQQNQNQSSGTKSPTTLQSQLNKALQQINEIKDGTADQSTQQQSQSKPHQTFDRSRSFDRPQRIQGYSSSLEGRIVEGAQVEGYKMEGAKVEGQKVEGFQVEGLAQKHRTSKFNKDRIAVTESSMKQGFAGEGCDDHYDMGLAYSTSRNKLKPRKYLEFSDNPIVQSVVMSQILERPKRRY